MFKDLHTPFVLNQFSYNMFNREAETSGLTKALQADGAGLIAYGPLSEGFVVGSVSEWHSGYVQNSSDQPSHFAHGKDAVVKKLNELNEVAHDRGQTLTQMALAWLLRDPVVTSVIIGTTSVDHLEDNLKATENLTFSAEEISHIDSILNV